MKIFIAGATGVLGRPTVRALVEAGQTVRGAARSEEKAAILRSLGAEPVAVDRRARPRRLRPRLPGRVQLCSGARRREPHVGGMAGAAVSSAKSERISKSACHSERQDRRRRPRARNLAPLSRHAGANT